MSQKIFRKSLVSEFLIKVANDDQNFIKLYLNKEKFNYQFDNVNDIIDSDFPKVPENLGLLMERTFKDNLKDQSSSDYKEADFECAKILYENLKLTPRQASNAEFWNYLHHTVLYKYIHLRWSRIDSADEDKRKTYIQRHWLMDRTSQKHLINFPLTTLWWSIYLSMDSSLPDPYKLSSIYFQNNRYRTVSIGGSSFVRHKEALLGILEYIDEKKLQTTAELGDEISKFINLIGGTKPLSFFDRNWFKIQLQKNFEESERDGTKKVASRVGKMPISSDTKQEKTSYKILKYFNINADGKYCLTDTSDNSYDTSEKLTEEHRKGYLLLCYNELGYINRVTVQSLLLKRREFYQNGLYAGNTLKKLIAIPEQCIIGISYKLNGERFFKAYHSDSFKKENDNVGLQGYKTIYDNYDQDSITYNVFPIELKDQLYRLIFTSLTATGKNYNNKNYKKEFEIINSYLNNSDLRLF